MPAVVNPPLSIIVVAALVVLAGCASIGDPSDFRPFRACVFFRHAGRELFVTGTIVRSELRDGERVLWFHQDNQTEIREIRPGETVRPMCLAISPIMSGTASER